MIVVTAKNYISEVKKMQSEMLAINRKIVPTIREMAQAGNVHPNSIYKFLNATKHRKLDLHIAFGIITAFRAYGHDTQISDLISYIKDE